MRTIPKYLIIILVVILGISIVSPAWGRDEIDKETCSYKEKKLYGKVLVVESFPDLEVKIVTSFPDLQVQPVDSSADRCGQWQFVESFPDLKVKFVTSFPDVTIKFVNSSPGLR